MKYSLFFKVEASFRATSFKFLGSAYFCHSNFCVVTQITNQPFIFQKEKG
jgi:hypothetical protein